MAFIPNPGNLPEVNHIDLVKTNNIVTNLEWVTRLGNALHAMENGRLDSFKRKLSDADVAAIRLRVAAGEAQPVIAREFSVHQCTVSRIARRVRRNHF